MAGRRLEGVIALPDRLQHDPVACCEEVGRRPVAEGEGRELIGERHVDGYLQDIGAGSPRQHRRAEARQLTRCQIDLETTTRGRGELEPFDRGDQAGVEAEGAQPTWRDARRQAQRIGPITAIEAFARYYIADLEKRVVPASADQAVDAAAAAQRIVASAAGDRVGAIISGQRGAARAREGQVLDIGGKREARQGGADRVDALTGILDDHVAFRIDDIDVVAEAPDHAIVAVPAIERVTAAEAVQRVIAIAARQAVFARSAAQRIRPGGPGQSYPGQLGRVDEISRRGTVRREMI